MGIDFIAYTDNTKQTVICDLTRCWSNSYYAFNLIHILNSRIGHEQYYTKNELKQVLIRLKEKYIENHENDYMYKNWNYNQIKYLLDKYNHKDTILEELRKIPSPSEYEIKEQRFIEKCIETNLNDIYIKIY